MTCSRPPSLLIICNNFPRDPASRYLTNTLAEALVEAGAKVRVAVMEWHAPPGTPVQTVTLHSGIEAIFVAPRAIRWAGPTIASASKWLGASAFMIPALARAFGTRPVDMMISFSPLVTTGFPILWAKRHFDCRSVAYITDFFPHHQHALGQIARRLSWAIGLAVETMLMRRFDTVACMSPAGVAYLHAHYRLRPQQSTPVLRLWADTSPLPPVDRQAIRQRHGLPVDRQIALFGGQISEGRGIEDIVSMARLAHVERPALLFLLIGEGRLEPLVRAYIDSGDTNLILHPALCRDAYLEIAATCDIGLVATVQDTGVPTFPSKTIDYLRAGLPIAASIETSTDYGAFITDNGFGSAVAAGDPRCWLDAIAALLDDPMRYGEMVAAGKRALVEHFDVRTAARTILDLCAPAPS